MNAPRIVLEREIVARLLADAERDVSLLGRRLEGLALAGVNATRRGCWLSRILGALLRLAARRERIEILTVAAEASVDANELAWVASAYASSRPLYPLVVALLDARRRGLGRSVAATLDRAMRDPGADVDQAISVALAQLRRMRADAA